MLGLSAVAGPRVALVGGTLAATNYIFVMWNRAALMESTMTALIVASWAAYAQSARRPAWGIVAGVAAVLAFFTKAAAAFFVAALALDALVHDPGESIGRAPARSARGLDDAGRPGWRGAGDWPRIRPAALAGVSVLQLGDDGHAQTVVRPP